ncbi:uncharacterized protein LOC121377807 [Gigantopelta aegis]|uniref:uncharacterized protein LOC121377807 n=1 Tax=Gigantopelta aegis TaxID=1735272 RepID=UPI001B88CAC5|nr:uncharacterized protein LOC121377807 [Gigantopelta aegis]
MSDMYTGKAGSEDEDSDPPRSACRPGRRANVESWRRRFFRRFRRFVRLVTKPIKVWRNGKWIWKTVTGKRGVSELDLNNDGHVDLEELTKMIGERDARDLMETLSGSSNSVPIEEFERNLRDLTERKY